MVRVIFGGQVFCQLVKLSVPSKDLLNSEPLCVILATPLVVAILSELWLFFLSGSRYRPLPTTVGISLTYCNSIAIVINQSLDSVTRGSQVAQQVLR